METIKITTPDGSFDVPTDNTFAVDANSLGLSGGLDGLKVVKYTDLEQCQRTAIQVPSPPYGKKVHKYDYIIPMDSEGIRVLRVFKAGESPGAVRGKRVLREHVELMVYPLDKAIKRFLHAGRVFGITQQARAYLEGTMKKRKTSKKGKATSRPTKILPQKVNGKKKAGTKNVSAMIRAAVGPLFANGKQPTRQDLIAACKGKGVPEKALSHHSVNSVKAMLA